MCAFTFSTNFAWNISHSKNTTRLYHSPTCLHVKYPLFLSRVNERRIFSTYFGKILKYQISWKSVHGDPRCSKRTVMTKLTVAFRERPLQKRKPQTLVSNNAPFQGLCLNLRALAQYTRHFSTHKQCPTPCLIYWAQKPQAVSIACKTAFRATSQETTKQDGFEDVNFHRNFA